MGKILFVLKRNEERDWLATIALIFSVCIRARMGSLYNDREDDVICVEILSALISVCSHL